MGDTGHMAGHAFLSHAREDKERVDQLQQALEKAGIAVWRDVRDLLPGQDWQLTIRHAISTDALAFVACFSRASVGKPKGYQNTEMLLAIEQFRLRPPGQPWLIPVRFDDCDIPDFDLGGGQTLSFIQRADLFGDTRDDHTAKLIRIITRILGRHTVPVTTPAAAADPILELRTWQNVNLPTSSSFGDRMATLKAREQQAADAAQRRADEEHAGRETDWAEIFPVAQWAAAEYASAGIAPTPVMWEWSEIKPGPQRRIRQKGSARGGPAMSVPQYTRKCAEIARGYPVWSAKPGSLGYSPRQLVITTSGQGIWVEAGFLTGHPQAHVPKENCPPSSAMLDRHAITEWPAGNPDQVIKDIVTEVPKHMPGRT